MRVIKTDLLGVLILEPQVFNDERGFFTESWNERTFHDATGVVVQFVQDNHSRSTKGVLRGLHYQLEKPQGKLVRVVNGCVFDVAVDVRKSSSTLGRWIGEVLSDENQRQLWIPQGFAHGFVVLSDVADFMYKTTDYYSPQHEKTIQWDDDDLNIKWPINDVEISISGRDEKGTSFQCAEYFT